MVPRRGNSRIFIAGGIALVVLAAVLYRTLIYVPSAGEGSVALNVLPWGEVAKIVSATGREIPLSGKTWTPCRLTLPEGSYYIHVTNPGFARPLIDTVTIRGNEVQHVTKKFDGFDDAVVTTKFE